MASTRRHNARLAAIVIVISISSALVQASSKTFEPISRINDPQVVNAAEAGVLAPTTLNGLPTVSR